MATKDYSVTFTPNDAASTGALEMGYEIRTGASGGGTLLTSGACTSGTPLTTATFNDAALVNGANTRYVRTRDGAANWTDTSFTVLMAITVTPGAAVLALTGFAPALSIGRNIIVPVGALALTGFAPTLNLSVPVGAGSLALTGYAPTVNTPVPPGTLTLTGYAPVLDRPSFPPTGTLSLTGFVPALGLGVTPGVGALALTGFVARLDMTIPVGVANLALTSFVPVLGTGINVPTSALSLTGWAPLVSIITPAHRVRVDVFNANGTKLAFGAITSVIDWEYTLALDQIGSFKMRMPSTDERAVYLAQRQELQFTREGEGLVFRGIISRLTWNEDDKGNKILSVEGDSIARKLVWGNTLYGLSYQGSTLAAVVANLLTGTAFTAGTLDVPTWNLAARFDAASKWAALAEVAKKFVIHVREDNIQQKVDLGVFGTDTGITFQNVATAGPLLLETNNLFGITKLKVLEESGDLWNSIIPQGGGTGVNAISLKYSTRSVAGGFAYDISSATGPDGQTYYYLEDAASVTAYDRSSMPLQDKQLIPLTNDLTGWQQAANALYDETVTYLKRHKDPQATYAVSVAGLKHLVGGAPAFRLGEKVSMRFQGVTERADGTKFPYKTINSSVFIMGMTRKMLGDGSDQWSLIVSTIDQAQNSVANQVSQLKADVASLQVGVQPIVVRDTIQERRSIDATHSAIYEVDYDANVSYLWQSKLSVKLKAVRTNATGASSGGSSTPTSSGGSIHTHAITPTLSGDSGGSSTPTSAGGSPHSHSVSGSTSFTPSLTSLVWDAGFASTTPSVASSDVQSASHTHVENGVPGPTGLDSVNHTHSLSGHTHSNGGSLLVAHQLHTHTVSGQTAIAESLHTHTVTIPAHSHTISGTVSAANESLHSHTVTIAAHTHALVYGIFDGSAPVTPAIHLTINGTDDTIALGGPWNADFLDLDITAYLKDSNGQPLRQRNTLAFTGSELIDIEVRVKSLVMLSPLIPV